MHIMDERITNARHAGLAFLLIAALFGAGCDEAPTEPSPNDAVFRVQACQNQQFNVRITNPGVIQEAEQLIGAADQRILTGELRAGSGLFNRPYSWHMDPATVDFADLTIEVCDGCPNDVQQNLDYWLNTVGRFCPWTSRIVSRIR
jgi:hypothetical protein